MFKQIKGSQFRLMKTFEVEEEADRIVREISGDIKNFSSLISVRLRNQIISRRISSMFLKENSTAFTDYPYITINAEIGGEDLIVTLGSIPDEESTNLYLNGVLEV